MTSGGATGVTSDRHAPASAADELAIVEQRLAARGYRMTDPRRRLLACMHEMGDRFDLDALRETVPDVSRSTAFRTIRLLLDLELACRVALPDGTIGYRLSLSAPYQHAICISCGAIQEIRGGVSQRLEQVLRQTATALHYGLVAHRLDVFGYCASCRQPPSQRSMTKE